MPTTNADWIKQRLPRLTDTRNLFSKNGLTMTVDQAVTAALSDNGDNKWYAIADLLEILAADYESYSERTGDGAWTRELLTDRAAGYRTQGDADGSRAAFQVVDATYQNTVCDEYTQPL